jgi:hypothetical protein
VERPIWCLYGQEFEADTFLIVHLVHARTLILISRSFVGGYKFVVPLPPEDEEDRNCNEKDDENRDGNRPGRDS